MAIAGPLPTHSSGQLATAPVALVTPNGRDGIARTGPRIEIDCRALVPESMIVRVYDRYILTRCLWHHDRTPSMRVYPNGCYCPACGVNRSPEWFYATLHGLELPEAIQDLRRLADEGALPARVEIARPEPSLPPQDLGMALHLNLTEQAIEYYLSRGLTLETITEYQLGWGSLYAGGPEGYTIPIYQDGKLRQIKQRLPGVDSNKYRSLSGCGAWFYLSDDLEYRTEDGGVFITEGEFDAIVLRQHGFYAGTSTGGVAKFERRWLSRLEGTSPIYCCFDSDERGEAGFARFQGLSGGRSKRIRLPTKDVSEFFLTHNRSDFEHVIRDADRRADSE